MAGFEKIDADELDNKDDDIDDVAYDPELLAQLERQQPSVPATQEQQNRDPADGKHAAVFRHEEDEPAKAAVFGVEAGHQFALGLGQVKRRALTAGGAALLLDSATLSNRLVGVGTSSTRTA